jgi:hypothetical protein
MKAGVCVGTVSTVCTTVLSSDRGKDGLITASNMGIPVPVQPPRENVLSMPSVRKMSAPPQSTGERPRMSKPCSLLRLALEIDVANRWVASAPATSASGILHNRDRA